MVPVAAVLEVEHECGFVGCGEGESMDCTALGGRHFGLYAIAGKGNAVVAWFGNLRTAVGIRPEAALRVILLAAGIDQVLPYDGHQGNVQQVSAAGAAQMGVRKTDNGGIGLMIARAPVPALRDIGRAGLHEAERHVCTHEHVAVETGADQRIHTVDRLAAVTTASSRENGGCS